MLASNKNTKICHFFQYILQKKRDVRNIRTSSVLQTFIASLTTASAESGHGTVGRKKIPYLSSYRLSREVRSNNCNVVLFLYERTTELVGIFIATVAGSSEEGNVTVAETIFPGSLSASNATATTSKDSPNTDGK